MQANLTCSTADFELGVKISITLPESTDAFIAPAEHRIVFVRPVNFFRGAWRAIACHSAKASTKSSAEVKNTE
jgi:hypothetical protein